MPWLRTKYPKRLQFSKRDKESYGQEIDTTRAGRVRFQACGDASGSGTVARWVYESRILEAGTSGRHLFAGCRAIYGAEDVTLSF